MLSIIAMMSGPLYETRERARFLCCFLLTAEEFVGEYMSIEGSLTSGPITSERGYGNSRPVCVAMRCV